VLELASIKNGFFVVILITVLFSVQAMADEVELENGDRLSGEVVDFSAGVLKFKTEYSKPISIKVAKIKRITTEKPVEVHLVDGQVLKGRLGWDEQGNLLVSSDIGVVASIGWKDVESINPPPIKWSGNVTLGATLESGNTDRASVSVGGEASRKTKKDRFGLKFLYNYAEEDDIVVTRNTYGEMKYRYMFTKHFYGYIGIELYSDEFQDLILRTVAGPGLGYLVWDDKVKALSFEAGAVYVNKNYEVAEDQETIDGRGAINLRWTILDTITLTDDFVHYYTFEDDSYQIRNEAAITSALTKSWALKLTHILNYNSDPPPEVTDTDHTYIAALRYKF